MRWNNQKITRKKRLAILALVESPTIRQAAEKSSIGESTIYRWLKDSDFKHALHGEQQRLLEHTLLRVQNVGGDAVTALAKIINDDETPASARVSAAKAVLDMSIKAFEMSEILRRIEDLEFTLNKRS